VERNPSEEKAVDLDILGGAEIAAVEPAALMASNSRNTLIAAASRFSGHLTCLVTNVQSFCLLMFALFSRANEVT
jgi:hypothetical protein